MMGWSVAVILLLVFSIVHLALVKVIIDHLQAAFEGLGSRNGN